MRLTEFLAERCQADPALLTAAHSLAPQDLFPTQARVLTETALLTGGSLLIHLPTGAGKTLLAEAAMLCALARREAILWLVPTRALAREHAARLGAALAPASVRVAASTRDDRQQDDDIRAGRVDVVVTVPEKARGLMQASIGLRASVRLVVVDEASLVEDPARGPGLESLLVLLRRFGADPAIVALDACAPCPKDLAARLGLPLFASAERSVALREGLIETSTGDVFWREGAEMQGSFRLPSLTDSSATSQEDRLLMLLGDVPQPVLVFVPLRSQAVRLAQRLADQRPGFRGPIPFHPEEEHQLEAALARRVAWHSAGLASEGRRRVEEALRAGRIDVCFATRTLGEGVNLGVRTVLVLEPEKFPGGLSLTNLFGRVGRGGMEGGAAFAVIDSRRGRPWEDVLAGCHRTIHRSAPAADAALQAIALGITFRGAATAAQLAEDFAALPWVAGELPTLVAQGERERLWVADDAGVLQITPGGQLFAAGGVSSETLAGWRTLLRRFTEIGGRLSELFLCLGAARVCEQLSLSADELQDARWPGELVAQLSADPSPLAVYFRRYFADPEGTPRRLHQAAKGALLQLAVEEGAEPRDLARRFELAEGDLAEWRDLAAYHLHVFERFSGRQAAPPVPARRLKSNTPPPPEKPPAPVLTMIPETIVELPRRLVLHKGSTGMVTFQGHTLKLTRIQFRMLELLARNARRGVPYERIENSVWSDAIVERQQIGFHRKNLEDRLQAAAPSATPWIETLAAWGLNLQLDRTEIAFDDAPETEAAIMRDVTARIITATSSSWEVLVGT